MSKRTQDWNEGLARDLQDPEFAREFIIAALAEGTSLQHVLAKVIRLHGVTEFARKARMAPTNVLRAVGPRANPTLETLRRLLKPFGLEVSAVATATKPKHAA